MVKVRHARWLDVLVVHRCESFVPLVYLCQAVWGAAYAAASPDRLATVSVLLAVVANLLLMPGGLALNGLIDVDTDSRHTAKDRLADAVARLGRSWIVRLLAAEAAVALALGAVVLLLTGSWIPIVAAAVSIVFHLVYNVEPVRLKRRGYVGPLVFGFSMAASPCFLSAGAVRTDLDGALWLIFVGLGVLAGGRTLLWAVPDRSADAAAGIATPPVRYGAAAALTATCVIMVLGTALLAAGLWLHLGPGWALIGVAAHLLFVAKVIDTRRTLPDQAGLERVVKQVGPLIAVGDAVVLAIALIRVFSA